MYVKVMRDQFQFRDESIVHMPTGAEFTRVSVMETHADLDRRHR